jgi:pyruvate dehydrogenase E2 component (dihydrolipoamide acetyltransferase)
MLLEIETDKATVELEAPESGVLREVTAVAGDEVPVGNVIAKIWTTEDMEEGAVKLSERTFLNDSSSARISARVTQVSRPLGNNQSSQAPNRLAGDAQSVRKRVPSSPKARRLAAERGMDLGNFPSSSEARPVTVASLANRENPATVESGFAVAPGRIWRIMAERTSEAWKNIPHFYLMRELDASNRVAWRQSLRSGSSYHVTCTDLVLKKVATSLRSHPRLTSQWKEGRCSPMQKLTSAWLWQLTMDLWFR